MSINPPRCASIVVPLYLANQEIQEIPYPLTVILNWTNHNTCTASLIDISVVGGCVLFLVIGLYYSVMTVMTDESEAKISPSKKICIIKCSQLRVFVTPQILSPLLKSHGESTDFCLGPTDLVNAGFIFPDW